MKPQQLVKLIGRFGFKRNLNLERTLTSAVTTAWGVDWNEEYIARDLMQNFFDANRQQLTAVSVREVGGGVIISAPAAFQLERLFYLGIEKGEDDIGHYGEGFKVAAACLLRDHAVEPIAISGNDLVVLRIAERTVADTKLCPIEYDFYRLTELIPGTVLLLPGCTRKLADALLKGLSHFFYDENSLLGEHLWSSSGDEFRIFKSANNCGHVFYRKLKSDEIDGIPLVLVINKLLAPCG